MLPLSGLTLCSYLFLSVISCPDPVIRLAGSEPALHVSTLLFSRSGGRQGSLWERSLHSARRCWFAACSRIQLEQVQLWRGGRLELAVGFPGRMLVGGRLLHGMELLRRGGHRGSIWSPGRRMVRPT